MDAQPKGIWPPAVINVYMPVSCSQVGAGEQSKQQEQAAQHVVGTTGAADGNSVGAP